MKALTRPPFFEPNCGPKMIESSKTESSPAINVKQITLPKGGGAISNIGDSFKPDIFSGTGSYSIPIPLSAARGFEPTLAIEYSTSSGNSEFGLGFSVPLSSISRETDRGIPRYDGTDRFIGSDLGKLVKKASEPGEENPRTQKIGGREFVITRYLPRLEENFSKIEFFVDQASGESHWEIVSTDNVKSTYGSSPDSRIFNPDNALQVYEWLIDRSVDSREDEIVYTYKAENNENVPAGITNPKRPFSANRYLHKIEYGKYLNDGGNFAYQVMLDYGEFDTSNPANAYTPVRPWLYRGDAFSSFKSGFEIRTNRLCRQILLFHCFAKELGEPFLVQQLTLIHQERINYGNTTLDSLAMLESAILTGNRKNEDQSIESASRPPLVFKYTKFSIPETPAFHQLKMGVSSIPGYIDESAYLPVDLNAEGLPGLLYAGSDATFYLNPLGNAEFSLPEPFPSFPAYKNLREGEAILTDIDGNGEMELVIQQGPVKGFYERSNRGWEDFRSFEAYPTDVYNPFLESIDITGDGKEDLLQIDRTTAQVFLSDGKKGYLNCTVVPNDTEVPMMMDSFPGELIGFTDVFGDGLSHRIRVTQKSFEVWPCLGYGKFGSKISLMNPPAVSGDFDKSRVYFADIDGSGTSDMIYAYPDHVEVFFNLSGNSFSTPVVVKLPELFGLLDRISFIDIYGSGTTCLLFSKMNQEPVHYCYNFVSSEVPSGSTKPYLLNEVNNSMGQLTQVAYCSSVRFALEDKREGKPWVTRVRFPVQVVEKMTVKDLISNNKTVTRFRYHDGYYNPVEKEFAGFGFVESWDTDLEDQSEYSVPPVYTKSWQFTGGDEQYSKIIERYKKEYYKGDPLELDFPGCDFIKVDWNNKEEVRQAYYALKGWVLRTEVYGLDQTPSEVNPFTVVQSNRSVVMIQAPGAGEPAVFRVDNNQSISYQYERDPQDPRIQQQFTLETDPGSGSIIKSCTIYLPRRTDPARIVKVLADRNRYVQSLPADPFYRRGVAIEQWQFEVLGLQLPESGYFTLQEVLPIGVAMDQPILYGASQIPPGVQAQTLQWSQQFFWNLEQDNHLSLGGITSRCLLHHVENAVFSIDCTSVGALNRLSNEMAGQLGGYLVPADNPKSEKEKYYWNRGLVQYYYKADQPAAFYLPSHATNDFAEGGSPLGSEATLEYDTYYLNIIKSTQLIAYLPEGQELESWVKASIDYNNLQAYEITDSNETKSQVLFDALGQVVVSAVFGNEDGKSAGATPLYPLNKYYQYPKNITVEGLLTEPLNYVKGACTFFYYDLFAFSKKQEPVFYIQIERQSFQSQDPDGTQALPKITTQFEDGFGRNTETKAAIETGIDGKMQWLVSGKTIYNSKGKPYKQYLPYFSDNGYYEAQQEEVNPTVFHYDPLMRIIRTDTPKGFFTKSEFRSWETVQYDEDDTVIDSIFFQEFMNNYPVNPTPEQIAEKDALDKAALFYNTPQRTIVDNQGNPAYTISCNLGKVATNLFQQINGVTKEMSAEIYRQLMDDGYLVESTEPPIGTWITSGYQPYRSGFALKLTGTVEKFSGAVNSLLLQHCLTTKNTCDILGRVIQSVDPRLYFDKQQNQKSCFSVQNSYFMGSETAVVVTTPDGGSQVHVYNIFNNQFWSWSARDFCQVIGYDRLQRRKEVYVKKIEDGSKPVSTGDFTLVEEITYGEGQPNAAGFNLNGEVFEMKDLAGKLQYKSYSLTGDILSSQRWIATKYTEAIDWRQPVNLGEPYLTQFIYNANSVPISILYPDGSVTGYRYNHGGLLKSVSMNPSGQTQRSLVTDIRYYANMEKEQVVYGNGVTSRYDYEQSTQRLQRIITTRKGSNRAAAGDSNIVQQIRYTYDPVGNVTNVYDDSAEKVFNDNQAVLPETRYEYDALYRLVYARGRQHPGILPDTDPAGPFKQSIFTQLPCVNDQCKLQIYHERYDYDNSGNLVAKHHTADSPGNWTFDTPVDPGSNRLTGFAYDLSGNQKNIIKGSTAELTYNCCENLVRYITVKRGQGQVDDGEYYVYDGEEQRVRKVQQLQLQSGGKRLVEKAYVGDYEEKKISTINSDGDENIELLSHSIRVMNGDECIAILNYWTKDERKAETTRTGQWQTRYQLDNLLGSVSVELDETGGLLSYEEYFPYGGTSIIAGINQVDVSEKVYRYSGKECDDFTGLYYYGFRYYIPWMGRWSSPDPAGTTDGLNLYAFVGGNPVTFEDARGLTKRTHKMIDEEVREAGAEFSLRNPKAVKTTKKITNPTGHRNDFGNELIADPTKTDNKKSWGNYYRDIMDGMDELISTSFTREFVAGALSKTLTKQQQNNFVAMINDISVIRFPTEWSGFASTKNMTSAERMQHPTVGIWRKAQVKGSKDPHYYFDLDRKYEVLTTLKAGLAAGHTAERIKNDMIITAISYTLNFFTAPAMASDQFPEETDKSVLKAQTKAREFLKGVAISLGVKEEPASSQAATRPWGSQADRQKRYMKRSVSKTRLV